MQQSEFMAMTAYRAYGSVTEFKNYQGLPMPTWEDLPEKIKTAWIEAIKTTPTYVDLDARERMQVEHALAYSKNYPEAGVPGHSQFMLLAKLAKALRLP
jgi:hypothetical protein